MEAELITKNKTIAERNAEKNKGFKFNKLTCIGYSHRENNKTYFIFRCDCGVERPFLASRVMKGLIKSCGCLKKTKYHTADKKFIGKRFGHFVIKERIYKNNRKFFTVDCDCGKTVDIPSSTIKAGKQKRCSLECPLREDLTGKKYGKLTIQSFYKKIGKYRWYEALCDCGNLTYVHDRQTYNAHVNCGKCKSHSGRPRMFLDPNIKHDDIKLVKELESTSVPMEAIVKPKKNVYPKGEKFGSLLCLSISWADIGNVYYNFECDCGRVIVKPLSLVESGKVTSCGCKSVNE